MILHVVGQPVPQGSKKAFVKNGHAVIVDQNSRALNTWREAIGQAARDELAKVPRPPMNGPVEVKIFFRFAPSKSDPYRFHHAVKPDLDKLVRAVFDALTESGVIGDDARISALAAKKRFANENETVGCDIEIYSLQSQEDELREARKETAHLRRRPATDDNQERLLA